MGRAAIDHQFHRQRRHHHSAGDGRLCFCGRRFHPERSAGSASKSTAGSRQCARTRQFDVDGVIRPVRSELQSRQPRRRFGDGYGGDCRCAHQWRGRSHQRPAAGMRCPGTVPAHQRYRARDARLPEFHRWLPTAGRKRVEHTPGEFPHPSAPVVWAGPVEQGGGDP